jgi:hypothetical protein
VAARKLISARLSPIAFTRILISPAPGSGVGTSTILRTSAGPSHKTIFSEPLYLLFSACERRPKAALFNFSLRLEKATSSLALYLGFAMRAEYHSGRRHRPS